MVIDGRKWTVLITYLSRIIIGSLFVFSGFVKAIDPWGTLYKFDEYFAALSISVWPNLELVCVFGLCAIEFLIGAFLICGCFRRSTVVLAAVIMTVMLPLTLWIAIANPVADCGCFGDAYKLSNWATFCKNVVITAGIGWLSVHNRRCMCLIAPALQWIAFVVSALFVVSIELFGYVAQPLIDFRQYKAGNYLVAVDSGLQNEPEYVFIYERNGVRKEFREADVLPDEEEGWVFIDRKAISSQDYDGATITSEESNRTFRIWSKDGMDDETEEAILQYGKELIVMMPDLREVSPATTWKLNSLYEWSVKNNVKMIAVVSGSPGQIADWEDLSMASYQIYTADDTHIKEVVRGNPGVVYLVDGIVEWKSTLGAINIDDFLSPDTVDDAANFTIDGIGILRNICYLYVAAMAVLVLFSFIPRFKNMLFRSNNRGNRLSMSRQ